VSPHDDDLAGWQDDPLVRALTGPASGEELAGEATAMAAFRAAVPVRSRRRFAGRLGVGGSALVVAVTLSGGVAAAYNSSLPAPLQRFASHVTSGLGVLAVPPANHPPPHRTAGGDKAHGPYVQPPTSPAATPATSLAVLPTTTPSPSPTTHQHANRVTPNPKPKPTSSPTPVGSPAATSPSPTPASSSPPPATSPTPTPTPTLPTSITITLGATKVAPGGTVSVLGHLATSDGTPVASQRVWLIERLVGQDSASEVAMGLTGADGSVSLTSPPLTHSARLRLVTAHRLRSAALTVVVHPTVAATVTAQGSTYAIAVTATGSNPGDEVSLQRHVRGGWQAVATAALDGSGDATFSLQAPAKRTLRYRVFLPRTRAHTYAQTRFVTPPV
jgi:hypothetical protein